MKNVNKIQIAPDESYGIGQDKKSHFAEWSVLDDPSLYAKVNKLAHSTYDSSKFTVVGSPNITNDGIASGFSSSNYLSVSNITASSLYQKSWTISDVFTCQTITNGSALCGFGTTIANGGLGVSTINGIVFAGKFGEDTTIISPAIKITSFLNNAVVGNKYLVTLSFNYSTGQYTLTCKGLDDNYVDSNTYTPTSTDKQLRVIYNQTSDTLRIGGGLAWTGYTLSNDLKYVSVISDGVPVFNGNKTGIDTIKSDDYTVVGSPTISDDGVALTGYGRTNNSNKFSSNTFNMLSNNQVFEGIVYIESVPSDYEYSSQGQSVLTYKQGNSYIRIYRNAIVNTNYVQLEQQVNGTWVGNSYNTRWALGADFNGWVKFKLYYDTIDNCYKCDCYTYNNGVATFVKTMTCSYTGDAITGSGWSIDFVNGQYQNYGKMDLNSIRAFDNGPLVYQPCLKIPYTLCKCNKKAVDVAYRGRVKDLLEQTGYNGYHTIDEVNENFTLPTHDFDDVIDSYTNEGNYWEQTVGQIVKQQGVGAETGVEVTLLRSYANDDDYALSIPYTSKTATSFVPAADGDWFAKGKVVL